MYEGGDWGSNLSDRIEDGDNDGRFLRCHYEDGGYIGMESLHGLPNTIIDKSDDFKSSLDILNNPEFNFDNWDDWDNWPTKDKQKYVMY